MTDDRAPADQSPADLVKRLRASFDAGRTRPVEWRVSCRVARYIAPLGS